MNFLDSLLSGVRKVVDGNADTELPIRGTISFKGSAVTIADNAVKDQIEVTINAGESTAEDVSYDPSSSGLEATDLQAAVDELAARPVAGDAADISYDPSESGLTATDVQDAIDELAARPASGNAEDIAYDPSSSGLAATDVQDAIDELASRPSGSDATKIQGVDVAVDTPATGQSLVVSEAGVYVPRFTSPSSDRLITTSGTVFATLGENLYIDVPSGDVDIKLPAAPVIGATVRVKRISANAALVTVSGNGSTIDGDTAIAIKPGEAALFRCYAAGKWARLGKCEAVGDGAVAHLGLDYSPIALWRLDSAADYSGNGLNLTHTTYLYVATPTTGFSCHLSSTNGQLQGIGSQFSPILTADDITVQAIVLRSSTYSGSSGHRLIQLDNSSGGALRLNITATSSSTTVAWSGASVTMPAIPHGAWTHVAVTRRIIGSNAIVKLYIDGALSATSLPLELPPTFTGTPRVVVAGSIPNYNAYYGLIGSVKVNDFALDDAQVYAEAQRAGRAA